MEETTLNSTNGSEGKYYLGIITFQTNSTVLLFFQIFWNIGNLLGSIAKFIPQALRKYYKPVWRIKIKSLFQFAKIEGNQARE
jgi:hypothetical protein